MHDLCFNFVAFVVLTLTGYLVEFDFRVPNPPNKVHLMAYLTHWLDLRERWFECRIFLRRFVKQVVSTYEWNNRILNTMFDPDKLCTVSDEAFALLVVENNYERWIDMYVQNDLKPPIPQTQSSDRKKKVLSNVKPYFTTGGNVYEEPPPSKTKGWSQQGIDRFNELFKLVKDNRASYPKFMREFVRSERRELMKQHHTKPKAVSPKMQGPSAMQDEFTDNEEDAYEPGDDASLEESTSSGG
jgi:hypothetical protein